MAITVYKQKTMNKKLRKKIQDFFPKTNQFFFLKKNQKNSVFFLQNFEKQVQEIEGITNCEITKYGDPL